MNLHVVDGHRGDGVVVADLEGHQAPPNSSRKVATTAATGRWRRRRRGGGARPAGDRDRLHHAEGEEAPPHGQADRRHPAEREQAVEAVGEVAAAAPSPPPASAAPAPSPSTGGGGSGGRRESAGAFSLASRCRGDQGLEGHFLPQKFHRDLDLFSRRDGGQPCACRRQKVKRKTDRQTGERD